MESVASFLREPHTTAFSFEILPPIRGKSIEQTYANLDRLMEFCPSYVNITTHRNQVEYRHVGGGSYRVVTSRKRPGTVAIAAALRERYGIRPVPHLICGDYSRQEIEDQLIDISYLGITDILVLRGDRGQDSRMFLAGIDGHEHAGSLGLQVRDFNEGIMCDGQQTEPVSHPISYGVAGYPEKHEEAMNMETDLLYLKKKVDEGAAYIVTQMFFDNAKYFDFVDRCRNAGIYVPVVPGIKPLTSLSQRALLPRTFHIDFPQALADELNRCPDNESVRRLGIEWGIEQARELKQAGVPSIHFYAMNATESVAEIARNVY